ncbi:MAG: arylesterase [Planctomycetota bacterium]|jgi:acyl-CoA thioesterase-1|nr:arylesterase [Planctomycetota bacterium]
MRVILLIFILAACGAAERTVVFLGDSLTAGYGLAAQEAYPALIGSKITADGLAWRVINAGESGDTTKGALARLDWLLRSKPDLVVVALGGNDGLRGLDLARSEANLDAIITKLRAAGAEVVLCGMLLPTNFGADYTERFAAMFPRIAARHAVGFYPFLLAGVAADPALNQADGIHPNVAGQTRIAEALYAFLAPALSGEQAASALGAAAK